MGYVCVKQHDYKDCGAACLVTVAKTYNYSISISKIREYVKTDKNGTTAYGIVMGANELGFNAKGVKATIKSIYDDFPLPAIAHVKYENGHVHFVVIHKIIKKKKQLIIADPAKGVVTLSVDEFSSIWTGNLIILVPSKTFIPKKEEDSIFTYINSLISRHKGDIFRMFILSLFITLISIISSFYFRILIDDVINNHKDKTLLSISIGMIILYLFKSLFNYVRFEILLRISQKLDITLLYGYFIHLLKLPVNFFTSRKTGEIINRFIDASKIKETVSELILTIFIDSILLIISSVLLYFQNSNLYFITLLIGFLYVLITVVTYRTMMKNKEKEIIQNAELTSSIVEATSGINTIKVNNLEESISHKTENKLIKLLKTNYKIGSMQNLLVNIKDLISNLGSTWIIWYGMILVLNGDFTVGQVISYNFLMNLFLDPLKNIVDMQNNLQSTYISFKRLFEIHDLKPEYEYLIDKKKYTGKLGSSIEFKDVRFGYGARKDILKGLSFLIRENEHIAIVGESGSGKSTIIKLILGLYNIKNGEIKFGNINQKDISVYNLRESIAANLQEDILFNMPLFENLTINNDKEFNEIIKISDKINLDFIKKLPMRFHSMVYEGGNNFSYGEKQRLMLVRTLLKDSRILIFDEPYSHLDLKHQSLFNNLINEIKDKTVITIAHRLNAIKHYDKIIVLKDGVVVEQGTHTELINNNGEYKRLYMMQSEVSL